MKKWTRKILVGMIMALSLTITMPAFTANAAVTECGAGWTLTNNTCTYPKTAGQAAPQCPGTLIEKGSTDVLLVCAEVSGSTSIANNQVVQNQISVLITIQGFLNRLIWPVLVMIGGLMDNSLLFGSGMEERLREIWVPIRNIVNILFVIALVGIALYNVLGVGDENGSYSIKSILPQIIVGIIAVNFSFLGIKVFLDGINVLTSSIFALPGQVSEGLDIVIDTNNSSEYDKKVVERFCANLQGQKLSEVKSDAALEAEVEELIYRNIATHNGVSIKQGDTIASIKAKIENNPDLKKKFDNEVEINKKGYLCSGLKLSESGKIFLSRWNSRNAALAMALNMSKIVFYEDIDFSAKNIEKLAVNVIFSMMLYLVYVASFLALFVVLLGRMVVLWISIAMSPLLLLGLAVPVIKEKVSLFGTIIEKFMKNAIAPLGIALSMTIGWIMLRAIQSVNDISETSQVFTATQGIPVVGLGTLQDLIVALGTVGIVWLGVFSAAEGTVAEGVTNVMKDGLTRVGKFVATAPLRNTPIMPIKLGGGEEEYKATGGEVMEVLNRIGQNSSARDNGLANKIFGQKPGGELKDFAIRDKFKTADPALATIFSNGDEFKKGSKESITAIKNLRTRNQEAWRAIKEKDTTLFGYLKAYETADDTIRKELGAKILANRNVQNAGITQVGENKPEALIPVEPKPITAATTVGTKKLSDQITDEAAQTAAVSTLQIATNQLKTELKKGNPSSSELKPILKTMHIGEGDNQVNFTTGEVKEALGTTDFDKLVKTLGSEKKVEDEIKGS